MVKLADMRAGQQGTIVRLSADDPARARKLMALGVMPGSAIQLERRRPAFVFRVGYSQFAVDEGMADGVLVRLEP